MYSSFLYYLKLLTAFFLLYSFAMLANAGPLLNKLIEPTLKLRSDSMYYKVVATGFKLDEIEDTGVSGPFDLAENGKIMFISRCGTVTIAAIKDKGILVERSYPLPNKGMIYCASSLEHESINSKLPNKLLYGVKGMLLDVSNNNLFVSSHVLQDNKCLVEKVYIYKLSDELTITGEFKELFSTTKSIPDLSNDAESSTSKQYCSDSGRWSFCQG